MDASANILKTMAVDLKVLLGIAIKAHRNSLGISQEELAHRAGLHRTYLSDVERGARNPSIESIEKLARALELSVATLFERAGNGNGATQTVEILLIEDDPRDVELTRHALKRGKITNPLQLIRDGAEALDYILATGRHAARMGHPHPQLILLDLNLPKVSGLEVLQRIKAEPRTRGIPVIVLTVSDRENDIVESRRLGASNYLVKPVGFQNFSRITPELSLGWTLVKPPRSDVGKS